MRLTSLPHFIKTLRNNMPTNIVAILTYTSSPSYHQFSRSSHTIHFFYLIRVCVVVAAAAAAAEICSCCSSTITTIMPKETVTSTHSKFPVTAKKGQRSYYYHRYSLFTVSRSLSYCEDAFFSFL